MLLGSCAAPTEATSLNPLFRADPNTGSYEVDPQAPRLPRAPAPGRRVVPAAEPAPAEPAACKHLYESHSTHRYRDPLTGLPALCAVVRCAKCGEIRHECQPGPQR